ncbi:MAG: sensor histidine kinase, partial [Verrucomicrobiales bacterium]
EQGDRDPFRSFEMGDVLAEKVELLKTAIDESGTSVEIEGMLPAVHGDQGEISQVVQNLLSNAIKYRGEASPVIAVSSAESADGRFWTFSVSDNGIGIPGEHLEEVFQPFRRLHGTGSEYKGSGVGLAICQKVIERHGGAIWVESEEGVGSTFHFTIAKPTEANSVR